MTNRRLFLFVIALIILVGGSYLIGNRVSAEPNPASVSIGLEDSSPASQIKTTQELIEFWRSRFERDPKDFISLTYLAQTFIRQGRETGDVSAYQRAETALTTALTLDPHYESALAYLSAVHFVKHEFREALDLANQVYSTDPRALQALATIGDAQLELGHYTEAGIAYRQLLERNASPAVYSRLARLAWLQGRPADAITQMKQAVAGAAAMGLSGESAAWYQYQLGELYFNTGQIEEADNSYTAALASFDNYYLALSGLGKVYAAQGRYDRAIEYYQRAIAIIPQPIFLAALGDLYRLTGRPDEAKRQYDTVEYIGQLAQINRQIYNRQLADFYLDHDIHLAEALTLAQTELEARTDIYGYDTAAWAYYKNGRLDQARVMIDQAMKRGTRDARLYYHAGLIASAQGHAADAQHFLSQALTINPYFDLLQARVARAALDQLVASSR